MRKLLLVSFVVMLFSCQSNQGNPNNELALRFFDTYSKRKEVDKMVSFYADKFEYENIVFESETDNSRFLYEEFYGWKDPNFIYENPETIHVDEILTSDSTIIGKGITMPYTYNGREVNGTRFVIILELDKDRKIKKQTDWFNYPMAEIIEAYHLKTSMEIK